MNIKDKGFTLIELLAVITIMGILMLIAIPAVSRTIENSRKSTFANTALSYLNAVKKAVQEDQLYCTDSTGVESVISSKPSFSCDYYNSNCDSWSDKPSYYYYFDSTQVSGQSLLESGGKSPWQSNEVKGVVYIAKVESDGLIKYHYSMFITDEAGYGFGNDYGCRAYNTPCLVVKEEKISKNVISKYDRRKSLYDTLTSNVYANMPTSDYVTDLFYSNNGNDDVGRFYKLHYYSCRLVN